MRSLLESLQRFFENQGDHKYSSTQVQAPNNIAEEVLAFSLAIPEEEIYTEEGDSSYGRELDIHTTIKYGLFTENAADVSKVLEDYKGGPIEVTLQETSLFEAKDGGEFDVLKITVESGQLRELNGILSKLENGDTHPEYKPHMTIAYLKAGNGKKYAGRKDFEGKSFSVDSFWFKGKDGSSTKIDL